MFNKMAGNGGSVVEVNKLSTKSCNKVKDSKFRRNSPRSIFSTNKRTRGITQCCFSQDVRRPDKGFKILYVGQLRYFLDFELTQAKKKSLMLFVQITKMLLNTVDYN